MAYIKISDPKIIDLPTIHQIINVVNQHSDNISALTNNFGSLYTGSTTSNASTEYQFDIASQQILYGVTKVQLAANGGEATWDSTYLQYTNPVLFVAGQFNAVPIVIAQPSIGITSKEYLDLLVNVTEVKTSGFKINLRHANYTTKTPAVGFLGSGFCNVYWIAIGKK